MTELSTETYILYKSIIRGRNSALSPQCTSTHRFLASLFFFFSFFFFFFFFFGYWKGMHANKHGPENHMILNFLLCWFLEFECPPPSPHLMIGSAQNEWNNLDGIKLKIYLPASKIIWILSFWHCVAVGNLLKNHILCPLMPPAPPPP